MLGGLGIATVHFTPQERLSPQEAEMFTEIFANTAETKQLPWINEHIARPEAPDGAAELTSWFAGGRPRLEQQMWRHSSPRLSRSGGLTAQHLSVLNPAP